MNISRLTAMRHIWHLAAILTGFGVVLPNTRLEKLSDVQLFRLRFIMSRLVYRYSSRYLF